MRRISERRELSDDTTSGLLYDTHKARLPPPRPVIQPVFGLSPYHDIYVSARRSASMGLSWCCG
jgi:hypothetical protein